MALHLLMATSSLANDLNIFNLNSLKPCLRDEYRSVIETNRRPPLALHTVSYTFLLVLNYYVREVCLQVKVTQRQEGGAVVFQTVAL